MRTRPFIKFFGSKFRLARRYRLPDMAQISTICEPFAGSGSFSMHMIAQGFRGEVLLNELDPRMFELWKWLLSTTAEEVLALPLLDDVLIGTEIGALGLPVGAAELIMRWQRMGINRTTTVSAWNGKPGQWGKSVRDYIAKNLGMLKNVRVNFGDYRDVPNHEDVLYFVDPPYEHNPVKFMAEQVPLDYVAMGQWVHGLKGKVIVCEQPPAKWLDFQELGVFAGKMQKVRHAELVWYNY